MTAARRRARRVEQKANKKLKFEKKIFDNVHGYIDITEDERRLIDTPIFQRLRRVSHLGLADYVYPGATHSRFSHCLGSMYVMHRIVLQLVENEVLDYDQLPALRLAALLHDVGHYPFSHVFEGTMRSLYKDDAKHERLGEFILESTSLKELVAKICDPAMIKAILRRAFRNPLLFQYLVSSSLDVDKIDYLQRDSRHTGVAYGAFDVDRLLRCLKPDADNGPSRLIVTRKGKQAIEDFLLGRFHMFQSVYHHKSVVAFELMLDRVADNLIRKGDLPSLDQLKEKTIEDEEWLSNYDDSFVWEIIKKNKDNPDPVVKQLIAGLLGRKSIKLAYEKLELSTTPPSKLKELVVRDKLPEWISEKSWVDKNWIFYKPQPEVTFLEPDLELTVYIEAADGEKPIPIIEEETSIIKKLWESQFRAYRVYTRDDESCEVWLGDWVWFGMFSEVQVGQDCA